jgi:hypothetical protein
MSKEENKAEWRDVCEEPKGKGGDIQVITHLHLRTFGSASRPLRKSSVLADDERSVNARSL